jgi:hypothetical protein
MSGLVEVAVICINAWIAVFKVLCLLRWMRKQRGNWSKKNGKQMETQRILDVDPSIHEVIQ